LIVATAFVVAVVVSRTEANAARAQSGSTNSTFPPGQASTASPIADGSIVPSGSECGSQVTTYEQALPTITNRTIGAQAVAIGSVQSIGPAQWNTSDGLAPPFTAENHPPAWAEVFRPVTVVVERSAKGAATSPVTVRREGGTVGCYTSTVDGTPDMTVGSRWAVFLGPSATSTGPTNTQFRILDAWPVNAAGVVSTPEDGQVSVASFITSVAAVQ
jgi:hypothetical protein